MGDSVIYLAVVLAVGIYAAIRGIRKKEKAVNYAKIPESVNQWREPVREISQQLGVPFRLAMAIIWVESRGNAAAVGSAGERGLMQLKDIAVQDLRLNGMGDYPNFDSNAAENIKAGLSYLKLQKKRADSWGDAIRAYNQGYEGAKYNREKADQYLSRVKDKAKFFE